MSVGSVEPLEELRRAGNVVGSRARGEFRGLDRLVLGAQWTVPGIEADHGGGVVSEVTEQPPEACGPARALVVRHDERVGADAGERGPGGESLGGRKRMPAAAVGAGEIGLRVAVGRSGDVTGEIGVAGAAVDEPVVHGASVPAA